MNASMIHPIPAFPGYGVSEDGRVWSRVMTIVWHELALCRNAWQAKGLEGYLKVKLCKNGKVHTLKAHHLVAMVFLGPRPDGMVVNHKDGNKANNHRSNLEYVTQSQNVTHAVQTGLIPPRPKAPPKPGKVRTFENIARGEAAPGHKLTADEVQEMRSLYTQGQASQRALALRYGVAQHTVHMVLARKKWASI